MPKGSLTFTCSRISGADYISCWTVIRLGGGTRNVTSANQYNVLHCGHISRYAIQQMCSRIVSAALKCSIRQKNEDRAGAGV